MSESNRPYTPSDEVYVHIVQGGHDITHETVAKSRAAGEVSAKTTAAAKAIDFSWCFTILCITASFDPANLTFSIKVTLAGITIANITIDPANPKACIEADVKVASAKLCIAVDFDKKTVAVSGEVCAVFAGCESFNQVIFRW